MNAALYWIQYVVGIVTLLGGVIAVHEFGHFIFAKYCGARVDVFSIGFGPQLFKKRFGETEYCLSLIPLGGYVKIYGQDPDEVAQDPNPQPARSLAHKPLLQRLGVFIGGPLYNFILAVVIFTVIAIFGIPKLPPVAARIVSESAAYIAGLRSGDKILAVNGVSTKNFDQVAEQLAKFPNKQVSFSIERDGQAKEISAQLGEEPSVSPYGEAIRIGILDGLDPFNRAAVVATTGEKNGWGLENGDKILSVDNNTISSWEDLEILIDKNWNKFPAVMDLKIQRGKETLTVKTPDLSTTAKKLAANASALAYMDSFGLFNSELFISQTVPGSPAEKAGIKKGDRVIAINGKRVQSFDQLRQTIQSTGENAVAANPNTDLNQLLKVKIERAGKTEELSMGVQVNKAKDHMGDFIISYRIGIVPQTQYIEPKNVILERTYNPILALVKGAEETWKQTVSTVVGIKKLAFGEVSLKAVGGPIMIGKIAGDAYTSRGWRDFLKIMALISISLGVFNLIPIPMLDGGHVVLALVESLRGKPLSKKVTEYSLKFGFSLLMLLIVFALYNDIRRVLPF